MPKLLGQILRSYTVENMSRVLALQYLIYDKHVGWQNRWGDGDCGMNSNLLLSNKYRHSTRRVGYRAIYDFFCTRASDKLSNLRQAEQVVVCLRYERRLIRETTQPNQIKSNQIY